MLMMRRVYVAMLDAACEGVIAIACFADVTEKRQNFMAPSGVLCTRHARLAR
jgi:hypothetical protein